MEDVKYAVVKKQDLTFLEKWVFGIRLLLLMLTYPLCAYSYLRAMYYEGYYNPKEFTQAIRLRLGSVAPDFEPLRPKPLAKKIRALRSEVPH